MQRAVRCGLSVLLLISAMLVAAPLSAHGEKPHGEQPASVQQSEGSRPAEAHADTQTGALDPGDASADQGSARTMPDRAAALLKNLHPATVHFPIALLLLAALAELGAIRRPAGRLRGAAEVMAVLGGLSASLAALFGWIHTGLWLGGESTMQWHRWIGTALALAGPLIAWLAYSAPDKRYLFRTLLFSMAFALLVQGFLGAEISRGAGHLWE